MSSPEALSRTNAGVPGASARRSRTARLASRLGWFAIAATLLAPPAKAIPLFSVDTSLDTLVRIESTTGAVTTVGALGRDALDIDLALTADGRLWGLNSGGGRVEIWEIDKATGALISNAPALVGVTPVIFAEGLGARGNQLKLGYDLTNAADSRTLGNIASGGAVTGGILTAVDIDALADGNANAHGLYAIDRDPGSATTKLFGMDPGSGASTLIQTYSSALGLHDLVTLGGGEGIALDTFTGTLYRLDLGNGNILGTVGIGPTPTGVYNGLAQADPVPDSVGLLPLAVIGLLLFRCRGQRRG